MFDQYLDRWGLTPDGASFETHTSRLIPVCRSGNRLMLKIALVDEEQAGADLMIYWGGIGAARVIDREGPALLMERAFDSHSLLDLVRDGRSDEATRIICTTLGRLHAPRSIPRPELVPLSEWFRDLDDRAPADNRVLLACRDIARDLLSEPRNNVVLHGDLHQGNVLYFGPEREWLAIDPKNVEGAAEFDLAALFINPELPFKPTADWLYRQLDAVTGAINCDRNRLLKWIAAKAGLSAIWFLEDGLKDHAVKTLDVAGFVMSCLSEGSPSGA